MALQPCQESKSLVASKALAAFISLSITGLLLLLKLGRSKKQAALLAQLKSETPLEADDVLLTSMVMDTEQPIKLDRFSEQRLLNRESPLLGPEKKLTFEDVNWDRFSYASRAKVFYLITSESLRVADLQVFEEELERGGSFAEKAKWLDYSYLNNDKDIELRRHTNYDNPRIMLTYDDLCGQKLPYPDKARAFYLNTNDLHNQHVIEGYQDTGLFKPSHNSLPSRN